MQSFRKGFTLAEVLIVLAILSVLVAVAIPAYSSTLEGSKETVCAANCRMIVSSYDTLAMLEEWPGDETAAFARVNALIEGELRESFKLEDPANNIKAYRVNSSAGAALTPVYRYVIKTLCPSGGEYTMLLSTDKRSVVQFICSAHMPSAEEATANVEQLVTKLEDGGSALALMLMTDPQFKLTIGGTGLAQVTRSSLDYPLPANGKDLNGLTMSVLQAASAAGIDLGGGSWHIQRNRVTNSDMKGNKLTIFFTPEDINSLNEGDTASVTQYTIIFNGSDAVGRTLLSSTKTTGRVAIVKSEMSVYGSSSKVSYSVMKPADGFTPDTP